MPLGIIPSSSSSIPETVLEKGENVSIPTEVVDPTCNIPVDTSLLTEKDKPSILSRKVNRTDNIDPASIKPAKTKKPHHNYGYMGGGAAAMLAGAGILALTPPIAVVGIPIFVMGLMAYAYAFCNFNSPSEVSNQNNQNANNDKNNKDKDNNEKDNPLKIDNSKTEGKFIAQPVDFSGGQVNFPSNEPQPVQPPPFQPNYSGPKWQDIYNVATHLGMPPVSANNFMNSCLQHLGSGGGQLDNPAQVINMPLAMDSLPTNMNELPKINIESKNLDQDSDLQPSIIINNIYDNEGDSVKLAGQSDSDISRPLKATAVISENVINDTKDIQEDIKTDIHDHIKRHNIEHTRNEIQEKNEWLKSVSETFDERNKK